MSVSLYPPVLVCFVLRYQRTTDWAIYTEMYFSQLWRLGSPEGKDCICEGHTVASWQGERAGVSSSGLSLLIKSLVPSWGPTLMTSSNPNYLPKAHHQMPATNEFEDQVLTQNLGGHSQTTVPLPSKLFPPNLLYLNKWLKAQTPVTLDSLFLSFLSFLLSVCVLTTPPSIPPSQSTPSPAITMTLHLCLCDILLVDLIPQSICSVLY